MGHTFCTEPQFLYKGALYHFFFKETGLSKWSVHFYQSIWCHVTKDESSLSVLLKSRISSIIFFSSEVLISLNVLSSSEVHLCFKLDSEVYISGQSDVNLLVPELFFLNFSTPCI